MMPAQPPRDRFRRGIEKKDTFPWDRHVIEPHLAVELVEAAAQWRNERILMARGDLAAQDRDARGIDRDDEAQRTPADLQPRQGADINVLDIGRARMHAEPPADDDAGIG